MFIGPYRNQNNWIQPNEPLILQEDLENSVIDRIIRNEFHRSQVKFKPARINWQEWLAGASNGRERPNNENGSDNFVQERRQHRPFVPGLHLLQYPQLSALTIVQHNQALRVLSTGSQLRNHQTASQTDYTAYEAMKKAYENEQKEYIKWAKQSWVNGDCIRALRPKPVLEATFEAEFKMRSCVVQSLPQDYYLAAQIPLETDRSHCVEMKHKADLITVDVLDLPCVEYPEVMESSFSVLKPCPLPRPCVDHPCNFVLPDEDSVSTLPLPELHRKLAEYAMSNDTQFIASENALHCLVQTQASWNLPISVIELITPDGDRRNVIVLGSEFAVQNDYAIRRTYKAYRHLLRHAFTPSFGQYKMKKQNGKSKVTETPRKSYEKPFFKEPVRTASSKERILKELVTSKDMISSKETVASKETIASKKTVASKGTVASTETVASNETVTEVIPSFSSYLSLDDDLAVSSDDDDDRLLIDDASPDESNKINAADVSKELNFTDTVKRKHSFIDTNKSTKLIVSDTTNANVCCSELREATRKMSFNGTNIDPSSDLVTTDAASMGINKSDENLSIHNRSEATSTPNKTNCEKTSLSEMFASVTYYETLNLSATTTNSISDLTNTTNTVAKSNFNHTSDTRKHNFSEIEINNRQESILTDYTVEMNNTELSPLKPNTSDTGSNQKNSDKSGLGDLSSISNKSSPEKPFSGFGTRLMSSLLAPDVRKLSFDGTEIEIASNFSEIDFNIKVTDKSVADTSRKSFESPVVTKNTVVSDIKTMGTQRKIGLNDCSDAEVTHVPIKGLPSKTENNASRSSSSENQSISDLDNNRRIINEASGKASDIITGKAGLVTHSELNINYVLTKGHISETDDSSTEPPNKKRKTTAVTRSYSLRSRPSQSKHVTSSKLNKNKAKGRENSNTKGNETSRCRLVSDSSSIGGLRRSRRLNSTDIKEDPLNSGQVECKLNKSTDKQTKMNTGVVIDKMDQSKIKLCSNLTNEELKSRKSLPENLTAKIEEKREKGQIARNSQSSSNTVSSEVSERTRRYLRRYSTESSIADSEDSGTGNIRCSRRYNLRSNSTSSNDSDQSKSKSLRIKQRSSTLERVTRTRIKRSISDMDTSNTDLPNINAISERNEPKISEQASRIVKNEIDASEKSDKRIERTKTDVVTGKAPDDDDEYIEFIVQIELKTENEQTTKVDKPKTNTTRDKIKKIKENYSNTFVTEDSDISKNFNNNATTQTIAKKINISVGNMTERTKIITTNTNEIDVLNASETTLDRTEANSETNTDKILQSKLHDLFSETDSSDDDICLIQIAQSSSAKRKETMPKRVETDRLRSLSTKEKKILDNTNNDRNKTNTYTPETNKSETKPTEHLDQSNTSSQTNLSDTNKSDLSKDKKQEKTSVSQAKQTYQSEAKETSTTKETNISEAKATNPIRSRSESVVSNCSQNTEDTILDSESLNVSTLSKEDIDDIIGVNNCTCQGTIFKVPPPRSFKKWQMSTKTGFDTFDVIVHASHKVRKGDQEVILEPTVEYQPEKGGAKLSDEQATSLVLSLMLRESATLLNVRIDHEKGEVILVERVSGADFLQTHSDKSRDLAASLHYTLAQLRHLLPGQYVLHHDSCHGPNAMIYTTKNVAGGASTLSLRRDAAAALPRDADETTHVRAAPELTPVILPCHISRKILPCAFTPYKNQVREDKKAALAQKPKHPPQALQWPKKKKKKIRRTPRETSYE